MKLRFRPLEYKNHSIVIIDQTSLPGRLKTVRIRSVDRLCLAIRRLEIRGAPLLGIAGAYGLVLGLSHCHSGPFDRIYRTFKRLREQIGSTRPTAVNLFNALDRMEKTLLDNNEKSLEQIGKTLLREACAIHREDLDLSQRIGLAGSRLIRENDVILTHCNAGGLATAGLGTALAVLFTAKTQGKRFSVFVDETRPLLQGSRLTLWELLRYGINATLICDSMAAWAIRKKKVNKIIVGADRIVRNRDAANKIGTYGLAVLARYHRIPFYIAAPSTTFDTRLKSGDDIPIEERSAEEVVRCGGKKTAPDRARVFNPAFDVVPARLISGFITEFGVLTPPFGRSFKKFL